MILFTFQEICTNDLMKFHPWSSYFYTFSDRQYGEYWGLIFQDCAVPSESGEQIEILFLRDPEALCSTHVTVHEFFHPWACHVFVSKFVRWH